MKNKYFYLAVMLSVFPIVGNSAMTVSLAKSDSKVCALDSVGKFPLVINEIMSCNIDGRQDASGNYGGWVELYNPSDEYVPLHDFYISDDSTCLKKGRLSYTKTMLSPKAYKVISFGTNSDHYSLIKFNLDADGGNLYISNEAGEILVNQYYPAGMSRISYARKVSGGNEWGYCARPYFNGENAIENFATFRLQDPEISVDSKLFDTPFQVQVNIPQGSTLRYTTNGSAPTTHAEVSTDGIFNIEKTTVLRFCLFQEGMLPSRVITRSYIKKDPAYDYSIPVLSLVTDEKHLYSERSGIFVVGTNGRVGNGQKQPCNWNMDWDRPGNVELITPEGLMAINQEANIAISGGWSRARDPKAFKVKAKKKYDGHDFLPYPVFKAKPYLKNKTWQVRNGGNDNDCRLIDAAIQEIVQSSGLKVEGQACQAVLNYINGKFIGLLNIREPNNKDYAYANYGLDDDSIDCFQMSPDSGYVQTRGTEEALNHLYDLSANASDPAIYGEIRNLLDIDEFVNYMAVHMYVGCADYGHNNIKGFRPRTKNGKFRLVLYDLDSGFLRSDAFRQLEQRRFNDFYDSGTGELTRKGEEVKFITIFFNLLENDSFRKQFIDAFCLVTGSVFEPARSIAIVDSMANQRKAPLALENKSPMQSADLLTSSISNRAQGAMRSLQNFYRVKLENQQSHYLKVSSSIDKGQLLFNDQPIPTNKFEGEVYLPVTLKANTPTGYRFVGWETIAEAKSEELFYFYGDGWKYYDEGSLDGVDWTQGKNVNWKSGATPMGFNTKTQNQNLFTVLDFGGNNSNKRPTYYFTREFNLRDTPAAGDQFTLNLRVDDGAVVYINGKEVYRHNLKRGPISYGDYALSYTTSEYYYLTEIIPSQYLKKGTNVISVEVHNNSATSSDIYFAAALGYVGESEQVGEIISTEESYNLREDKSVVNLTARFELMADSEIDPALPPVVINEISASNSVFINDYFKKRDWIELYNRSNEPVDVAGMYLSDNRTIPHKYLIEKTEGINTIIEPKGHLVFWADHKLPISQLHTNFKMASEGGEIILTAADDSWSDNLIYMPHDGAHSIGRYPDGGEQLYVMTAPTLSATNILNSYASRFEEPEVPVGIESFTPVSENLSVQYAHQQFEIHSNTDGPVFLNVYNVSGQCVKQQQIDLVNGYAQISMQGLRRGTYIARVSDALGNQKMIKFAVFSK